EPTGSAAGAPLPPPEAPTRASAPRARSSAPSGSAGASAGGASGGSGGGAGARRTRPSGGTLKARFSGRCRCGKAYDKGETIAKNPDGWGHPTCV
ncbi:ribonuclease HI, partial [Streptomyces sp. NPDC057674]